MYTPTPKHFHSIVKEPIRDICTQQNKPQHIKFRNFCQKIYKIIGKDGHYSKQALKHVQQEHHVSVHVTNNVTNIPIHNLGYYSPKTIPT